MILRDHLAKKHKFEFWCEARLGRLAWRASDNDSHKRSEIVLRDVCKSKDKEFYTRYMHCGTFCSSL